MEQRFGLGRGSGSLLVRQEGETVSFEADMRDDKQGLYKAYAMGPGGSLPLGTLMPEGGRLVLRRTIPMTELKRKGMWPVTGGEARLSFSFGQGGGGGHAPQGSGQAASGWMRAENPARLMGDRFLAQTMGEARGVLYRREEGGFALAIPMEKGSAFPMTPLFCFAHLEKLSDRLYAIFHFNSHGCPIFRNKNDQAGNTEDANQKKE